MRARTTWNQTEILRQAATTRTADPYAMNQDHLRQQPGADQYVTGDPSTFAEDVSPNDWSVEYQGGAVKRNEIGMPEVRPDTFNHPEKTASLNPEVVVKKAELTVRLARRMLGNDAPEAVVEDQAVALMHMPDADVVNTYNRLAGELPPWLKKDDKKEDKKEDSAEEQQKQAADAMARGDFQTAATLYAKLASKRANDPQQGQGQPMQQQSGQQQDQQAAQQQQQQAGQQNQQQQSGQQQNQQQQGGQQQSAWQDSSAQQQQQAQAQPAPQDVEAQVQQMIQEAAKQANQQMQQAPAQQQAGQQQMQQAPAQQQAQGQGQQQMPPAQQQQGAQQQQAQGQGQQQMPPAQQQQAAQQQVQASDDALLDQMLMPGGGAGASPSIAEMDIQMDTPAMDIGDVTFNQGEDEMLRQLFATGDEAMAAQQAQQAQQGQEQGQGVQAHNARTAALRTVGTRPTAGVARIGGAAAPQGRGQEVNQLAGLWQSAPDVREAFGLKTT